MRQKLFSVVLLLVLALAAVAALAQQQSMNLWAGTWKRNLAKSSYSGPPPTGEQTVKLEVMNGLLWVTTTTTTPQRQSTTNTYVVRFDGSERVTNAEQGITATYKYIDGRNYEGLSRVKGQPTTTTRYALSVDGKTHTLTTTGKDAQGVAVNNVVLYEKQ